MSNGKPHKHRIKKTIADLERMKLYLQQHPACSMKDAAKIIGVPHDRVRKWKSLGWLGDLHMTKSKAMRKGYVPAPDGRLLTPEEAEALSDAPKRRKKKKDGEAGAVVSSPDDPEPSETIDPVETVRAQPVQVEPGSELKIATLRNKIKQKISQHMNDAKAVANYATALKTLSGVRDIEMEEIYESEKIIRIYVPEEHQIDEADITEVGKIEY